MFILPGPTGAFLFCQDRCQKTMFPQRFNVFPGNRSFLGLNMAVPGACLFCQGQCQKTLFFQRFQRFAGNRSFPRVEHGGALAALGPGGSPVLEIQGFTRFSNGFPMVPSAISFLSWGILFVAAIAMLSLANSGCQKTIVFPTIPTFPRKS